MIQIRHGVFETNSSSTHSLTICMKSDFDEWVNGKVLFAEDCGGKDFVTREEALQFLATRAWSPYKNLEEMSEEEKDKVLRDECFYTYEQYLDDDEMEHFSQSFTTAKSDEVIAFGRFGFDY